MRKSLFILALVLSAASSAFGKTNYVYTDASTLPLFGKVQQDTFEPYSRLPLSMKDSVRGAVWTLGRASSGLFIRFVSDAGNFDFKWRSTIKKELDNMTAIGVRGMALYVLDEGEWTYLSSVRPNKKSASSQYRVKASRLEGAEREYMLYLSLYDGVLDLQIGVPEGRSIKASTLDSPRAGKPVIIYGTSILQGASASNPGMCGTAQLSRRLDRVVINLGFSGNCLLEEPIAEYMASYPDPGMYVIDNWNKDASIGEKGLEKCLRILLKAHPDTPILIADRAAKPNFRFDDGSQKEYYAKIKVAADVVDKLKKEGYRNIYRVTPSVLGRENSGTSDGTHFTDEAFTKWADAVYPVIKKAYRKIK